MQKDYSVLRGPCPEGFHVPLFKEFHILIDILQSFGWDSQGHGSDLIRQRLHMPFAGFRQYNGVVNRTGNIGLYRMVNPIHTVSGYDSCALKIVGDSTRYLNYSDDRSSGNSIRPFKDVYVAPDSSRTVIYGTLASGVLWDQTNGIISITDGTNGITIADKNVGATQVYNDGDTMSEANCGKYYQWGNNYGFPFDGAVRTESTDVNRTPGYGPWNYYYSNIYISHADDWSHPQNNNLRGYDSLVQQDNDIYIGEGPYDYSAMRGPCPDGFHIPSLGEYNNIYTILATTFGLSNTYSTTKTYLKIPPAGYRQRSNSDASSRGTVSYCWSCTNSNDNSAYCNYSSSSEYNYNKSFYKSNALTIRAFKDESVVPDSSWTTLYDGSSIATGAGVFHNAALGLISLSGNGQTWITIADKNLGATVVYNNGDSVTAENTGNYYQWGNCYGFTYAGTPTKSSSLVNASTYGPGNFYSSSTFITRSSSPYRWDSPMNSNLWGGDTGITGNYDHLEFYVSDMSILKGPGELPGFHIPTKEERQGLKNIMNNITVFDIQRRPYLHLPYAGDRGTDGSRYDNDGEYRSSTPGTGGDAYFMNIWNFGTRCGPAPRGMGLPIRLFRNNYLKPDSSWTIIYDGSEYYEGGGIFWNQTKGVISITDGTNGITIADKNVGATQVYNDGDTLSADNCGEFFQRGNNRGFPFTGTLTTSSTKVDASGYGPGDYYLSDTFITTDPDSHDWSSVQNDNLWGYESFMNPQPNVPEIYVGDKLVWSNYKPITPHAGIYRCPTKGLISMSLHGTNRITIADRNLGATGPLGTGLFYQRGNNYGFTWNPISINGAYDASGYGPGNYYFGTLFRRMSSNRNESWDSSNNNNLWGGETGTNEATQGPCGEGWHIPSSAEWTDVATVINTLGKMDKFFDILLINEQRYLTPTGSQSAPSINLWMNQKFSNTHGQVLDKYSSGTPKTTGSGVVKSAGIQIRPFRNTPVIPNDTSRIKLV